MMPSMRFWQSSSFGANKNNNNFASFHRLTDITGDDCEQNLEDIISYLQNFQNEFERYFSEINTFSILMKKARNLCLCTLKWKMFLKQCKKNLYN